MSYRLELAMLLLARLADSVWERIVRQDEEHDR